MANLGTCSTSFTPIGQKGCLKGNPLKMASLIALTLPNFKFPTKTEFQTEDDWNTAIANEEIFILEKIEDIEDANVEAVINETGSGVKRKNRDGKRGAIYKMNMDFNQNKNLQSYANGNLLVFIIDEVNNIIGTSQDGVTVQGLKPSFLDIRPMMVPTSSDINAQSIVEIQFANWEEIDINESVALGTELSPWIPKELIPLSLIEVVDISITAGVITATFQSRDETLAHEPTIPIRSIVEANLNIIDQASAPVTPDGVTETTTPGVWEIDVTTSAMTAGTIQLIATSTSLFKSNVGVVS